MKQPFEVDHQKGRDSIVSLIKDKKINIKMSNIMRSFEDYCATNRHFNAFTNKTLSFSTVRITKRMCKHRLSDDINSTVEEILEEYGHLSYINLQFFNRHILRNGNVLTDLVFIISD